jgi:3-dehydrosphinganine reductase
LDRRLLVWKDKVALVTGGSSGIGLAISKILASAGAHVWLVARNPERLQAAMREVEATRTSPEQVCGIAPADVTIAEQAAAAVEMVTRASGVPDLVVNSAGDTFPGYVEEISLETFRGLMDVNYFGTVNIIKSVLPGMLVRSSGHIINISSLAGFFGVFGYSAYTATKFAVRGFSDVLRMELKPRGIRVSVVFPPDTDTPQLAYEAPLKPPETKILSGNAKVLSANEVARITLRDAARGRYVIIPGLDGKLLYRLSGLLGNLTYPIMDWMLARGLKKVIRNHS